MNNQEEWVTSYVDKDTGEWIAFRGIRKLALDVFHMWRESDKKYNDILDLKMVKNKIGGVT